MLGQANYAKMPPMARRCAKHMWEGDLRDRCPYCASADAMHKRNAQPLPQTLGEAVGVKAVPHDGKDDSQKPNPALLFLGLGEVFDAVSKVLDGGAKKYAADSWQKVPDGEKRYIGAFYRHLNDMQVRGWDAINEKDFGLPEIDHLITNLLFIRWFQLQRTKEANAAK